MRDSFLYFEKKTIFRKRFEVITYFCFIFKRENKIRKKTLNVILNKKRQARLGKTESMSGG